MSTNCSHHRLGVSETFRHRIGRIGHLKTLFGQLQFHAFPKGKVIPVHGTLHGELHVESLITSKYHCLDDVSRGAMPPR